ncbi:unnamed protein product [Symbiodinium sp. CCMP2456]|nr:unnamed protein product [Symbiodinium sp. CCMP2456]
MALKPAKKIDKKEKKTKKVKKEVKEKKEGKGSARPASRRLFLKTSPRSAKRKPLTTDPKPEKEEPKKQEPKAPKPPKLPKQAPEHTREPKSTEASGQDSRQSERSAPKGKEAPAVSPKELKEQKKQAKKASAKAEKKQKKKEKRERKTKDEGEENSHKQDPLTEGEDGKTEVAGSETPGPQTNLLERFNTEDSEVNQEYLESLLQTLDESPVEVSGSDDEESSGADSEEGEEGESDASEESSEEASCKRASDNESDDDEANSPTGSSSSDNEEEEDEAEEERSDGTSKAAGHGAIVPVNPAEPDAAQRGTSLALVAVGAEGSTVGTANSVVAARTTNKREWDTFTRQCQNRKLFPIELADYYEKSKTDMFNLVKVNVERIREKKTTARAGALAMKKRDIVKTYPERGEELCKKLRASGRYYRDEEFPSDSEEIFYYVRQPRKVNVDTIVGERATMGANMHVDDSATMEQLTGQDGVFCPGALPGMKAEGAAGGKALADILVDEAAENPKKKQKTKKKGEATETVEPATIKDQAEDIAKEVLKMSGDASKLSLSLQGLEMSGTLSKDLATFSKECAKMFTEVQKRLRKKNQKRKDQKAFREFVAVSKDKIEWWKKAEVAGKAFTSAANRKKKAKAKPVKDGKEGAEAKA